MEDRAEMERDGMREERRGRSWGDMRSSGLIEGIERKEKENKEKKEWNRRKLYFPIFYDKFTEICSFGE